MTDFVEDVTTVSGTDFVEKVDDGGGGGGGGGGTVDSVVAGTNISVNSTDPANPVVSTTGVPTNSEAVLKSLYDAQTVLAAVTDNTPAAVTMAASTILARLATGDIKAATVAEILTLLNVPTNSQAVLKSLYDANTVLAANSDDTPAALTMGASTVLARLAAGNIKAATIQEILALYEGSSFPGSPAKNDRFFRTDLGLEFYYDGTRWLTTQLFRVSGYGEFGLGSVTPNPFMRLPIPTLDMWMVSLECTTYVVTNTGSAYWTVSLVKATAAAAETTIVSFDTSADTQANYVRHNVSIGAALGGGATYPTILGKTAKTNSPGGLFVAGQLNYRLIGT